MRIALSKNDVIINVVEAESVASAQALFPLTVAMDGSGLEKGWVKDGGVYVAPTEASPAVEYQTISITKFARLCRGPGGMTDAMLVAAHNDTQLTAVWITLNMSTQIHKDDPELMPGLTAFSALGYLPNGVQSVLDAWPTK